MFWKTYKGIYKGLDPLLFRLAVEPLAVCFHWVAGVEGITRNCITIVNGLLIWTLELYSAMFLFL